jgi:hypothetical protein
MYCNVLAAACPHERTCMTEPRLKHCVVDVRIPVPEGLVSGRCSLAYSSRVVARIVGHSGNYPPSQSSKHRAVAVVWTSDQECRLTWCCEVEPSRACPSKGGEINSGGRHQPCVIRKRKVQYHICNTIHIDNSELQVQSLERHLTRHYTDDISKLSCRFSERVIHVMSEQLSCHT